MSQAALSDKRCDGYSRPLMFAALILLTTPVPRAVYAAGNWASFDRGGFCSAVSRSARIVTDRSAQAQAGFTFDRAGQRRGQFAARLGRPLRPGSAVMLTINGQPFLLAANANFAWSRGPQQEAAIIAAARAAPAMRIVARAPGGHFVDLYALDGAPGAIDAAAACAAHR